MHDAALLEEPELVRAAGAAAGLALRNERLDAELRARYEELRASRARLVAAGDAARRKIERDLHDGAQQHLVSLALTLRMARTSAEAGSKTATLLDGAIEELKQGLSELRELARGIHPAVLTERGLEPALAGLAARAPVPVTVSGELGERLPPELESAAYFVVCEALTNVAKYASASEAEVSLRRENGRVVIDVRDDGIGGADAAAGSGLSGIADRVAALDGCSWSRARRAPGRSSTRSCPTGSRSPSRALAAPGQHAQRAERGLLVRRRRARVRDVLRVVGDDVQDRDAGVAGDGVGEVAAQPLRGLARQRADDHLVVAHRVPDLGQRLQRDGVADDALALLDPRCTPGVQGLRRAARWAAARSALPGPAAGITRVAWIGPRSLRCTSASMSSGAAAVRLASTIT